MHSGPICKPLDREYMMSAKEKKLEQNETDDTLQELAVGWTIFAKASEGIMLYPANGDRVLMANEAAARMHGYSRQEMQNLKLPELEVADQQQLPYSRKQRLLAGEQLIFEKEHYHKDGRMLRLAVSSTLISLTNDPDVTGRTISGLMKLFTPGTAPDIISRLLAGDKFILEFQRDITAGKQEAEAALKLRVLESLGVLAGSVAHDLNNLLQGLLGNISLAKLYTPKTSQAFKFLKDAEECHTTALELKDQLVAFATGDPAAWEAMTASNLFRNLDLLPAGGSQAKGEPDRLTDFLGTGERKEADNFTVPEPLPRGARILVMDDEPAVLAVATEFLQYVDYRVDGVVNGEEALQAYQKAVNSGDPYQAVILDLFIDAGMGGKEAMEGLREIDPQVKAIVSSGNANDPLITNYSAHGFAASLLKPYRLEHLQETLARLLRA